MHAAISNALDAVFSDQILSREATEAAFSAIMDGDCSETDIAAFLTALRVRGEAFEEIAGAAHVMRARATRIPCSSQNLLDTCGTGGDELRTFNISTATAFVVAGAGVSIAKHGNRSVSSSSGSADVLEKLGVNLQLTPEHVGQCVDEIGLGFCFAPLLHSAMKNVVPVRKALGFRTIFNLLGPLTNPAGAQFQLLGSNRIQFAEKLAAALAELGCERAFVVCGNDELDEVSLWGETTAFDVSSQKVVQETWTANDFGLPECSVDELSVDSPEESAARIDSVLNGESGASRDIVVANAAAGLLAVGQASSPLEGARIAQAVIDDGKAKDILAKLIKKTNELSAS